MLVGNKVDLADSEGGANRAVLRSEAMKIASEHGIGYFETSAKENINVKEVMVHIMGKVYENIYGKNNSSAFEERESIIIKKEGTNQGSGGI